VNFQLIPVQFRPGATTAGDDINLPSWAPPIGAVLSGEIWRLASAVSIADHAAHSHISFIADETDAGGAAGNTVPLLHGDGTATTTIKIEAATGQASAKEVNSSEVAAMTHTVSGDNYVVSVTVTVVDSDTVQLDVDTVEGDVLVLRVIPAGAIPAAA